MRLKLQTMLFATLALGLAIIPAMAQDDAKSKMAMHDKMAMDHMSKDEKAAMFDKMSDTDKMSAAKMAGHDFTKMNAKKQTAMMGKMTVDQKAMAVDKMTASKMDHDKMDHDKMDKMKSDKMKK